MKNVISTIQLREEVKRALENLKEKSNQSYEDVIVKLIDSSDEKKKKRRELLIEECKEMAEESLRITKEWENTDAEMNKYIEW